MYLYLHGFSSSAQSHKAAIFRERLSGDLLIPDYPAHAPEDALPLLRQCFKQQASDQLPLVLIGSSLGALYALLLAQEFKLQRVALINPCLDPGDILAPYLGRQKNMSTGKEFTFSRAQLAALQRLSQTIDSLPAHLLILMDAADELIDVPGIARQFGQTARVVIYPGGSHAFAHMDEAVEELIRLSR